MGSLHCFDPQFNGRGTAPGSMGVGLVRRAVQGFGTLVSAGPYHGALESRQTGRCSSRIAPRRIAHGPDARNTLKTAKAIEPWKQNAAHELVLGVREGQGVVSSRATPSELSRLTLIAGFLCFIIY